MRHTAIVLGSQPGTDNIGDTIAQQLRAKGWAVSDDDCCGAGPDNGRLYGVPEDSLTDFEACIITLGTTSLASMRHCLPENISDVIYGSLELPLLCIRKYVQDRQSLGKIVVMGSYAHDHSLTNCSPYCAAKAGLTAAVKELGWELTPDFLTYIVHPYHVPTTLIGKKVVSGMINHRGFTAGEEEAYQRKDLRMQHHLTVNEVAE